MPSRPFLVYLPTNHTRVSDDQLPALVRQRLRTSGLTPTQTFVNDLRRLSPVQVPFGNASRESNIELAMPLLVDLARTFVADVPRGDGQLDVVGDGDRLEPNLSFHGELMPRPGLVYVRHPHDSSLFLRMAEFHSYLLAEKREEFERLVAALGGKSVRLNESDDKSREAFVGGAAGNEFKAGVGADKSQETNFTLEATFGRPQQAPHIPADLCWYPVEPDWRAMATARLNGFELLSRTVEFRYSSDFAVTIGVAERFTGLGLSIGGTFESVQKVMRRCTVEFWPLKP